MHIEKEVEIAIIIVAGNGLKGEQRTDRKTSGMASRHYRLGENDQVRRVHMQVASESSSF